MVPTAEESPDRQSFLGPRGCFCLITVLDSPIARGQSVYHSVVNRVQKLCSCPLRAWGEAVQEEANNKCIRDTETLYVKQDQAKVRPSAWRIYMYVCVCVCVCE